MNMSDGTKFAEFLILMNESSSLRATFLNDPSGTLKKAKVSSARIGRKTRQKTAALARAEKAIKSTKPDGKDFMKTFKAVSEAVKSTFGSSLQLKFDSLAYTFLEVPTEIQSADITGTGTVNCTYDPWDGCSPDVDG
jgi:hypothetical protein